MVVPQPVQVFATMRCSVTCGRGGAGASNTWCRRSSNPGTPVCVAVLVDADLELDDLNRVGVAGPLEHVQPGVDAAFLVPRRAFTGAE
ncbi:hypothetical protein ACF07B_13955 [Streptomyces sp. NPDC015532]|uniref:hypothetical protein n=1 Tax=Streptomyces sp. NPDC015532 TaxID=3364960 RepID=UPI0036FFD8D0